MTIDVVDGVEWKRLVEIVKKVFLVCTTWKKIYVDL